MVVLYINRQLKFVDWQLSVHCSNPSVSVLKLFSSAGDKTCRLEGTSSSLHMVTRLEGECSQAVSFSWCQDLQIKGHKLFSADMVTRFAG